MEIFAIFLIFWVFSGSFLGHSGDLGVNLKNPEISTNTNRMKLNICELNSLGNTLQVKYKFGSWQILKKKSV